MAHSVSLLLLMKNELGNLRESWEIIAAQDYTGPIEYVYIDSGSTDGTIEFMAERGISVHSIPSTAFHHGRTRNLAASLAKNDILVYISGDAIPLENQWLRNLVQPFDDPRVGATYGRQIAPPGIGPVRRYGMEYEYPPQRQERDLANIERPHLGLFRMSNANSAIRADVWRQFKFNESIVTSEDVGLCKDILEHGMKVVYVGEAAVYHCHEKSLWYEYQKAFDSGISLTRLGLLGNPKYGSESGYGIRRLRKELGYFAGRGRIDLVLKSLAVCGAKWLGVQTGKRGDQLPRWITRRISAGIEKMYD